MHTKIETEKTNVLQFPVRNDSFDQGASFGRLAVATGTSKTVAYGQAITDSVSYCHPMQYIRGFMSSYQAEEEKMEIA